MIFAELYPKLPALPVSFCYLVKYLAIQKSIYSNSLVDPLLSKSGNTFPISRQFTKSTQQKQEKPRLCS